MFLSQYCSSCLVNSVCILLNHVVMHLVRNLEDCAMGWCFYHFKFLLSLTSDLKHLTHIVYLCQIGSSDLHMECKDFKIVFNCTIFNQGWPCFFIGDRQYPRNKASSGTKKGRAPCWKCQPLFGNHYPCLLIITSVHQIICVGCKTLLQDVQCDACLANT